jgi:hypothetical protein
LALLSSSQAASEIASMATAVRSGRQEVSREIGMSNPFEAKLKVTFNSNYDARGGRVKVKMKLILIFIVSSSRIR